MALIEKAKGRETGSGYARLFDDEKLGHLISRVQSAVISSGTKLERMIKEKMQIVEDLDDFLKQEINFHRQLAHFGLECGGMIAAFLSHSQLRRFAGVENAAGDCSAGLLRLLGRQLCCVFRNMSECCADGKKSRISSNHILPKR